MGNGGVVEADVEVGGGRLGQERWGVGEATQLIHSIPISRLRLQANPGHSPRRRMITHLVNNKCHSLTLLQVRKSASYEHDVAGGAILVKAASGTLEDGRGRDCQQSANRLRGKDIAALPRYFLRKNHEDVGAAKDGIGSLKLNRELPCFADYDVAVFEGGG